MFASSSFLKTPFFHSFRTYSRVFPYYQPHWLALAVGMLAATAVGSLEAVMPLGIKLYLELFIEKTGLAAFETKLPAFLSFLQPVLQSLHTILASNQGTWLIPVGIVAFTSLQGLLSYTALYFNTLVSAKVTAAIKRDLYDHLMRFETSYFDTTDSGMVLFRIHSDGELACGNLVQYVKASLTRLFSVITLSLTLLFLSWKLALMALLIMGTTLIPLSFTRKYLKGVSNDALSSSSNLATHFTESCQGNRVIATYNLQQRQSGVLQIILEALVKNTLHLTRIQGLITPLMHTIAGVGVGLVLWFGTQLIQQGELSMGSFAAFLTSLILLYTPVKSLGNMSVNVQMALLALERVFDLFDRETQLASKPGAPKVTSLGSGLQLCNVSFRYRAETPWVLQDINLSVRPGETIALVGASGSGKTTLAHLLLRLYDPTEGAILLDGQDLRSLDLPSVRQQMAAVFQDNFIFMGSLRDNIMMARETATEAELQAVLKAAYLEDFVASLPNGLNTEVGERGVALSGGQKQRLAIARALLKNASLVLLDEATSALDNQSEAIVQKAIDSLMKNRTVVVIAHRLSTVQNADRIIVMHEGRLAEVGSHEALLANNGLYTLLYNAQFKPKPVEEAIVV